MYLSNSELKQLDVLKKKTPAQRFLMMTQLIASQIEAMKAGIRYANPDIDDEGLENLWRKKMLEMYSLQKGTKINLRKYALHLRKSALRKRIK